VAAELSRAFERISGAKAGGLMTPHEFSKATAGREGALVYLEPLRKEQMITNYGFAAYEEALRKLAHQVRAKLPEGCCLCRRDQGDYLAFLDTTEEFARAWANEVAASASFIALTSSETAKRVPLALRAKVALIAPQSNRLSQEIAA
jgi:GGDEF domain-containing protein